MDAIISEMTAVVDCSQREQVFSGREPDRIQNAFAVFAEHWEIVVFICLLSIP